MKRPATPENEAQRQASLCALELLDTPSEERYDRYTRIAKRHFDVSIALVCLVDTERQWFKSRHGLNASETPRDISFCGHAILSDEIFCIPDASKDPRFADNPLVTGAPNIRFYAGAPLHAPDGQRVGTLCIIDDKPHEFSAEELAVLRDLADGVEAEFKHPGSVSLGSLRRIHPITVASMILGLLFSLLLFSFTWQFEEDEILLQLQRQADERSAALAVEVESLEDILHGMAGLYAASVHVGSDEFRTFFSTAFPSQTEIHSAVWLEYVHADELKQLYQMAAQDGYTDFRLRKMDETNGLVDASPDQNNLVVYNTFNREQKQWLPRGLNLLSQPVYNAILQQVLEGKASEKGQKLYSVRHEGGKFIELYLPVYEQAQRATVGEQDNIDLRGFVGLQVDVADSVEAAYRRHITTAAGLDVYIVDINPKRSQKILYFHASRARTGPAEPLPLEQLQQLQQGRYVSTDIRIADTRWRVVLRPIEGRYVVGQTAYPWFALGTGLLITLLVAGYINAMQRRRVIVEQEVQNRTHELDDSREQIRAVVDTVVDGIITIDSNGIVQSINPAAETIFDYSKDDVVGCNIKMLMPEPYSREHDGYLQRYLFTGERKVIGLGREVEGRRKDGSTFPMELAVSQMNVHGKIMFTGIVRDITERKRLDRMKSEFISTVSHELRTPLTSIRGSLGLILGKSADMLPVKARKMLEMATRNSERLTLLINDILDLEKIESGSLVFEFRTLDLLALCRQAIEDNEGYAREHQVRLKLVSILGQAYVSGDEHRLLQVFANLISNAVKYSPQDGEVTISVAILDGSYRIEVRDQGTGIPEEFRSRIFQRFAQADSSDTREKGGTGLGLSITKAIVERHDGTIDYESEQGKGTVFHFELPMAQAPILMSTDTEADIRVLICEDNAEVAEILAKILQTEGMASDIAGSAGAAMTLLGKYDYRLLLLDLSLPDMDGLQFLQQLRDTPATEHLPVIVVSGRAEEGRIAFKGDAMRVVDWVQKPFDGERLKRAVRRLLSYSTRPHILHVEDDMDIVHVMEVLVEDIADLSHVDSVRGAREQLAARDFDLVILDLGLADGSGVELLDELKSCCPVIIFSAQVPDREISAQVTAALTKTMTDNEHLLATIRKVLEG